MGLVSPLTSYSALACRCFASSTILRVHSVGLAHPRFRFRPRPNHPVGEAVGFPLPIPVWNRRTHHDVAHLSYLCILRGSCARICGRRGFRLGIGSSRPETRQKIIKTLHQNKGGISESGLNAYFFSRLRHRGYFLGEKGRMGETPSIPGAIDWGKSKIAGIRSATTHICFVSPAFFFFFLFVIFSHPQFTKCTTSQPRVYKFVSSPPVSVRVGHHLYYYTGIGAAATILLSRDRC
ncbi:hypothetical protein GGS23DRAFT_485576 [Durotheca rogersii]|uniref:uncharacterized protein n=1 Tax=Durotheca rogersii TaxID=419775 RepID=UPI0022201D49|nr:uncharacterized protein GGS23DRAFT_485576 [Durotheca rogersii]KAI5864171.1 hypothetical protein GGS23DRAFT_485576 [Durotheca rogersii]